MDYVAETLLGYTTIKLADLAQAVGDDDLFTLAEKKNKKDKKDIDMSTIPTEQLSTYACEDADITFQLTEILAIQILSLPSVTIWAKELRS